MLEIRFDKTNAEVALLIWFLVDHSVLNIQGPILSLPALRFSNRQHIIRLHRYLGGNYLFFKIRNIVSQSETFNMPQSDITHNLIV
jgi:hypothetical protein